MVETLDSIHLKAKSKKRHIHNMITKFYLYECISFNDLPHTDCKLISHIKENKGMVAMMLVLCPSNSSGHTYIVPLNFTGGVFFHCITEAFSLLKEVPLSRVLFSWGVRGTSSTKSTVTECVKRVMVVYTRSFDFFYV